MENRSSIFHEFWSRRNRNNDHQTGSQCRQENPDASTSESRILEIQRNERAALILRAESMCAETKARNDAALERLGLSVQDVTVHLPKPPAFPRGSTKPSLRERRISPLLDVPRLADDSPAASTSSVCSLSSVDTHTPNELRAISLIRSPVEFTTITPTPSPPPPPPQAVPPSRRRVSRLPVFSAKTSGADKMVADGCRLQTAKNKVEAIVERLERFRLDFVHSPQPPAAIKMTPAVRPLAPTPPTVFQTNSPGFRQGMFLCPEKADSGAGKRTTRSRTFQTANIKVELQPLTNPVKSLALCFKLISSDDWMTQIDGLKTMQALAQHHPEILKPKLHEVCLALIDEVKNSRLAVSCTAMNILAELYVHLQKAMDSEAEETGRALLLKLAQTTNDFTRQQANLALDAMVQNCSPGRTLSALLKTGLRHRCAAVRVSMAQHLHLLADSLGPARILKARRNFTERFLTAVSTLCMDAAPKVRHHGHIILQELALHQDFMKLWTEIVPEKERCSMLHIDTGGK